jgi:hypothetical protein
MVLNADDVATGLTVEGVIFRGPNHLVVGVRVDAAPDARTHQPFP